MTHNTDLPLPEAVIPHRPPHLWLDGVTEVEAGASASGFWTPGPEHYEGHFPDVPLLMAIKQVESLAQLGAYALMFNSETTFGLFKGIEATSFNRPVKPGETLDLEVSISDRITKRDFKGQGTVRVGGVIACEATILGTILPERAARRLLNSQ